MTKKQADDWFAEYGESHQNPTNKTIHWICVPAIVASLLALIWSIPVPTVMNEVPFLNWATILIAISMLFYFRLSIPLAVGMLVFSSAVIAVIVAYEQTDIAPLWQAALAVFVIAWVGQFIGHKIEGKKPSFFQDLQFLLIGPAWLLGFIYRRLGIKY